MAIATLPGSQHGLTEWVLGSKLPTGWAPEGWGGVFCLQGDSFIFAEPASHEKNALRGRFLLLTFTSMGESLVIMDTVTDLCSHAFPSVGAIATQQANPDKVPHKQLTSHSSEDYKSKVVWRAHFLVLTLSPAGCVPRGGSGKGALWALTPFRRALPS